MHLLAVQIIQFVDESQPGWVRAEFLDAAGLKHRVVEKVPVITDKDLWIDSEYPCSGAIGCKILEAFKDDEGRKVVRISTQVPWGIESSDGISEFTVLAEQVSATAD